MLSEFYHSVWDEVQQAFGNGLFLMLWLCNVRSLFHLGSSFMWRYKGVQYLCIYLWQNLPNILHARDVQWWLCWRLHLPSWNVSKQQNWQMCTTVGIIIALTLPLYLSVPENWIYFSNCTTNFLLLFGGFANPPVSIKRELFQWTVSVLTKLKMVFLSVHWIPEQAIMLGRLESILTSVYVSFCSFHVHHKPQRPALVVIPILQVGLGWLTAV